MSLKDYKIISVESRKGGVGKTTVARLLAEIATAPNRNGGEKKVCAVVIDLDFLGTDAAGYINNFSDHFIQVSNRCLLEWFNEKTLSNNIESKEWKPKDKPVFYIPSLLSSYAEKEPHIKYTPQILFDELHSKWFMNFLKELFRQFVDKHIEYQMVFILDNPPGYSEFVPVLEDYLVEVGPKIGKTIFVCSLDNQDLKSCAKGMGLLYKKYQKALLAAQHYHEITWHNNSTEEKTEKKTPLPHKDADSKKNEAPPPFDKRLFDTLLVLDSALNEKNEEEKSKKLEGKSFYFSKKANPKDCIYYNDPKRCIGLFVNKVPNNLDEEYLRLNFNVTAILQDMMDLGKKPEFESYFRERILENGFKFNLDLSYQFILGNFDANQIKLNTGESRGEIENNLAEFRNISKNESPSPKQEVIQGITRQFYSFFLIDRLEKKYKRSGIGDFYILFDPRYKFAFASLKLFSQPMSLIPDFLKMNEKEEDEFSLLNKNLREAAERKCLALVKVSSKPSLTKLVENNYKEYIAPLTTATNSPAEIMASNILALPFEILKDILSKNATTFKSTSEFAQSAFTYAQTWLHEFASELIKLRSKDLTEGNESDLRKKCRDTFFTPDLLTDDDQKVLNEILKKNDINIKTELVVQAISYLALRYLDLEHDLEFFMNCSYNLDNPKIKKDHVFAISRVMDQVIVDKTQNMEAGKKILKSAGFMYMSDSKEAGNNLDTIDDSTIAIETDKLKTELFKIWDDLCNAD